MMDSNTEYAMGEIKKHFNCSVKHDLPRKERMQEILLDHYSNELYDMDEETLEQEYSDKIGNISLL
jgi:hypothetical protein